MNKRKVNLRLQSHHEYLPSKVHSEKLLLQFDQEDLFHYRLIWIGVATALRWSLRPNRRFPFRSLHHCSQQNRARFRYGSGGCRFSHQSKPDRLTRVTNIFSGGFATRIASRYHTQQIPAVLSRSSASFGKGIINRTERYSLFCLQAVGNPSKMPVIEPECTV